MLSNQRKNLPGFVFFLTVLVLLAAPVPALAQGEFLLPDTGQKYCSNNDDFIYCAQPGEPFYGQDADYNTINQPSYTKLDADGADLPDTADSWVMVRDNVTDLIWEVKTDDGSVHYRDNQYTWYDSNPATNGGNPGTSGNGTDTEDFINEINLLNFGGHSDWRLPTIKEMYSLVNRGQYDPAIVTDYFPNINLVKHYWSSTPVAFDNANAFWVSFLVGTNFFSLKSGSEHVRAVRGKQPGALGRFVDNGDGTVSDTGVHLMWQQVPITTTMTWESALSYCQELDLAGYTDWRLPNTKEIQSIKDFTYTASDMDPAMFPDNPEGNYWTSTPADWQPDSAMMYISYSGHIYFNVKAAGYYVRAVRNGQAGIFGYLDVSITGTGSGVVASDPAGINCGSDCGHTYPLSTSVTLTATPGSGASFGGWSGGGCSGTGTCQVTIEQLHEITAPFYLPGMSEVEVTGPLTVDVTYSLAMGPGATEPLSYTISGTGKGSLNDHPDSAVHKTGNTYTLTWTGGEMLQGGDVTISVPSGFLDVNNDPIDSGALSATDTDGGLAFGPATSASPAGDAYSTTQTVSLICADDISGCANTYYTTDGSAPTTASTVYSDAVKITIASDTTLKFFSQDAVGNSEVVQTEIYDFNAPEISEAAITGPLSMDITYSEAMGDSAKEPLNYYIDGEGQGSLAWQPDSVTQIGTTKYALAWQDGEMYNGGDVILNVNSWVSDQAGHTLGGEPRYTITGGGIGFPPEVDSVAAIGPRAIEVSFNESLLRGATFEANYSLSGSGQGSLNVNPSNVEKTSVIDHTYTLIWDQGEMLDSGNITITVNDVTDMAYNIIGSDNFGVVIGGGVGHPPTTTASIPGGTYAAVQNIVLSCTDDLAGCGSTYYTTDGSTPDASSKVYTSAISISSDTTIKFFSQDAAGNTESIKTENYIVDIIPPQLASLVVTGSRIVEVEFSEPMGAGATTAANYSISGTGQGSLNSNPNSVSKTGSTNYTLTWIDGEMQDGGNVTITAVNVQDSLGNTIGSSNSVTDAGGGIGFAPATTASTPGGSYPVSKMVSLTCDDGIDGSGCSTTYYTFDGSAPTASSTKYSGPITIDQDMVLKFFSVDLAGNIEAIKTETYYIGTFTITASAGTGGSISPEGEVIVTANTDQTFTIVPDPGYMIEEVIVDGTSKGAVSSYNFTNVTADGTVAATFKLDPNRTIVQASESGGIYNHGLSVELTASGPSADTAVIWYSTGSTGDPVNGGRECGCPINVTQSTILRFVAKVDGLPTSLVYEEVYTIDEIEPLPPELTITRDGESDPEPLFDWTEIIDAASYDFQLADNSGFDSPLIDETGLTGLSYQVSAGQALTVNGTHYARVRSWDEAGNDSDWNTISFRYDEFGKVRRAIIVAGQAEEGDNLWPVTKDNCDFAFNVLRARGFDAGNITYLTPEVDNPKRTGDAIGTNVQDAINQTQGADELVIFMHDHGSEGKFWMNKSLNQYLTPGDLNTWLDQLQVVSPDIDIVIVYEACYSGSFVALTEGKTKRTFIASADYDETAYLVPKSDLSFSLVFWKEVYTGSDIKTSFLAAKDWANYNSNRRQNPQVDADGDGVPNEDIDKINVTGKYIGTEIVLATAAPIIGSISVSPTVNLDGSPLADITAYEVVFSKDPAGVFATIYPPGYTPPSGEEPALDLPTVEFVSDGQGNWTGRYDGFTAQGGYKVSVYAKDQMGLVSDHKTVTIYQGADTAEISLVLGWNLISLWLQPEDTSIALVLTSIDGFYSTVWAYVGGGWQFYDPANTSFNDLETMEAGIGYWIKMIEAATLSVSGTAAGSSCELDAGWNLVGYSGDTELDTVAALASIENQYESVWSFKDGKWYFYDPANPNFSDLIQMEPGLGYWIKTSQACTWTLP